jgi:hypothetical protein
LQEQSGIEPDLRLLGAAEGLIDELRRHEAFRHQVLGQALGHGHERL